MKLLYESKEDRILFNLELCLELLIILERKKTSHQQQQHHL